MNKLSLIAFAVCLGFCLVSCDNAPQATFKHVETLDWDHGIINPNMIVSGNAHSGNKFGRADTGQTFGPGYSYKIPDSLIGHNINVKIDGWVRSNNLDNNYDLILSCSAGDSLMVWNGLGIKDVIKTPNEWVNFSKSFSLTTQNTNLPNTYISVIIHNIDAGSIVDLDDLIITYTEPAVEE